MNFLIFIGGQLDNSLYKYEQTASSDGRPEPFWTKFSCSGCIARGRSAITATLCKNTSYEKNGRHPFPVPSAHSFSLVIFSLIFVYFTQLRGALRCINMNLINTQPGAADQVPGQPS